MLYYKKNNYLVRVNETEKSYLELFDDEQQNRIMQIKNEKLYNDLIGRIENYGFEVITNVEFDNKLSDLKSRI